MAYSYVRYSGNGSTTNYTFPFPSISADHIKVRVNATLVTNWSFLSANTIQFFTAPANGAVIEIRRETPKESAIVNFTDGSVLLERDLDLLAIYSLYLAQETKDGLDTGINQDSLGVWQAQNRRIANVDDPVDPQDVATKAWSESTGSSFVGAAAASAAAAATSASNAATSATAAAGSAASASTSASLAANQASISTAQSTASANSASTATTKAAEAVVSANSAAGSAATATTKASEASASQASSAASASAAASSEATSSTKASESAASATLASEWATKLGSAVASGEFSAKHHAQQAAASALEAAAAAGSKPANQSFTGNGSQVAFTLTIPYEAARLEVFVNSVQQEPTYSFSTSGTTLTFTAAPNNGARIFVRYL